MKKRFMICTGGFFLAVIAAFIFMFNCAKAPVVQDGTWTGVGSGRNGNIEVSITVKDGKIADGKIVSEEETDFAKPAAADVMAQAVSKGNINSYDAVSGATITSKATAEAIRNALAKASGQQEKAAKVKDDSCDIVIIGAGGAGLAAAIEGVQNDAKVILLEKMGVCGGNTTSATGGMNAAETVDWLMGIGVDLSDVGKMAGSTNKRTHRPKGGAPVGAHMIPVLEEAAVKANVDLRKNSKVLDILKDGNRASGVVVETNGQKYKIMAKAVIIATGGFGANPQMIVKYKPELKGFGTTNHKGATGDAFEWIKKFDGQLTQMDEIQTHPTVVPGNGLMITEAVRGNGAIMINRDGKRFCSEMATLDVMSKAILEQKGQTAYLVFDTGVRKSLKAIEGYVKKGLLTEGETPEALAEKLGIPAAAFADTIRKYNEIQKSGNDAEFGRKASEMPRDLSEGPYFAVEVGPAIHHTMGGIKINPAAEVLNSKNQAIPGLFAAGEVTGGVHGGNRLGGNAVADICVYGKIAADSALEFIKK